MGWVQSLPKSCQILQFFEAPQASPPATVPPTFIAKASFCGLFLPSKNCLLKACL